MIKVALETDKQKLIVFLFLPPFSAPRQCDRQRGDHLPDPCALLVLQCSPGSPVDHHHHRPRCQRVQWATRDNDKLPQFPGDELQWRRRRGRRSVSGHRCDDSGTLPGAPEDEAEIGRTKSGQSGGGGDKERESQDTATRGGHGGTGAIRGEFEFSGRPGDVVINSREWRKLKRRRKSVDNVPCRSVTF